MKLSGVIIKTLILLIIFAAGYYFFGKIEAQKKKDASLHYSNLVKNKLAYVSLARLNPKNDGFDIEKSNLIGIIKDTNKTELKNPINAKEKGILTRQNTILEKVFATKSYEEGVFILKSEESVALLTDQTKLIEELGMQIAKLKESPLLRLGWR